MRLIFLLKFVPIALVLLLLNPTTSDADIRSDCTPAYAVFDRPLKIVIGSWELSFRLLAVGCKEKLHEIWPPNRELLEQEIATELKGTHPVRILFMIDERSPDLRKRIARRVNKITTTPVVEDVFLYDAKAAE